MASETIPLIAALDKDIIHLPIELARLSRVLSSLMDDCGCEFVDPVPISDVSGAGLRLLETYLAKMKEHGHDKLFDESKATVPELLDEEEKYKSMNNLAEWQTEFAKSVYSLELQIQLLKVANALDIHDLLWTMCKTFGLKVAGKNPQEIFNQFEMSDAQLEESADLAMELEECCKEDEEEEW